MNRGSSDETESVTLARRAVDRILSPSYLEGVSQLGREEISTKRRECLREEERLSYVRRILQARLDLVRFVLSRRERGDPLSLSELVRALPGVLSPSVGEPRGGAVAVRVPSGPARRREERDAWGEVLLRLPEMGRDELELLARELEEEERRVSEMRRGVQRVLDALTALLAERWREELRVGGERVGDEEDSGGG